MIYTINLEKNGAQIKKLTKQAGYSVAYIQNYLQLSCPQPIYRWFKGKILPSVDNLYLLSKLLNVHMEDLIVSDFNDIILTRKRNCDDITKKRIMRYVMCLSDAS